MEIVKFTKTIIHMCRTVSLRSDYDIQYIIVDLYLYRSFLKTSLRKFNVLL